MQTLNRQGNKGAREKETITMSLTFSISSSFTSLHPLYKYKSISTSTITITKTLPPKPHFLSIKSSLDDETRKQTSWVSPDWLTSFTRNLSLGRNDDSGIPIASAKLEDVSDLLGGALFLPLFKWMNDYGPIYRLAAGPRNFVIVSDPAIAKHVLKNYGTKYAKGLVAEVSEFLFGSGFAIAEGSLWTVIFFPPPLNLFHGTNVASNNT